MPSSGVPVPLVAPVDVHRENLKQGDLAEASFRRTVVFVVTGSNTPVPADATATVGQMARTPGGIGREGAQISGCVTKIIRAAALIS